MKKLSELLKVIEIKEIFAGNKIIKQGEVRGEYDKPVEGLVNNSRNVKENYLFVSISGFKTDGAKFINDAIEKGCNVIVSEKKAELAEGKILIIVEDARVALAQLAAEFYGYPDKKLRVIGVTGTTGKTTVTYLIKSILEKYGKKVSLIGTIAYKISKDKEMVADRTTPESVELEAMFKEALDGGVSHIVMEVSSHSLCLHRVEGIEFDQAIFTNLGLDHLDYHKTRDEYLAAKVKLFSLLDKFETKGDKAAIINIDDEGSRKILESTKAKKITYGLTREAQVYAIPRKMDINGIYFEVFTNEGNMSINLNLPGNFNIYNALAAISSALCEGVPLSVIKDGLESVKSIPGRFEKIKGRGFDVIVDYAHTPESLRSLLEAARQLTNEKLIVVFGCGGDRDRSKRPIMGEIAALNSDLCILTSDNPRTEDPLRIILDVESGIQKVKQRDEYIVAVDRQEAIEKACKEAFAGDVVVIAGKGHEQYQIIGEEHIHFDDREEVKKILKEC